ncbi:fimbrial protein [Salmonella enterica subsp. enterica]|nr:fimbrial protein [Salmonella enterica subsp. enterica]
MAKRTNCHVLGRILVIAGLIGGSGPAPCLSAETGMDVTLNANIVENTCQVSIPEDGKVHLSTVGKNWFYNPDGSTRLQPTDAASGTLFKVRVKSCVGDPSTVNALHFSFQPQTKQWPAGFHQVFINETTPAAGGTGNTGIVIFSKALNSNVLNSDGTSDVVVTTSSTSLVNDYEFYARLQNTGPVTAGKVTSRVVVNAIYN